MSIEIKVGCKGFFKLQALKVKLDSDGIPVRDKNGDYIILGKRDLTGWFPNKLLNNGKNYMGSGDNWLTKCQVGTDNTAPLATDTGLLGYVEGTDAYVETIAGAQTSAPYFMWLRRRFRFDVGTTAANLSEVGVGWNEADGPYLVTRALIVDAEGNPTTVTPLADEILDVWYEWRFYPPTADVTGTVTLDSVSYNYTIRASEVTSSGFSTLFGNRVAHYSPSINSWLAYSGDIGAITERPDGVSDGPDVVPTTTTYQNNSYQNQMDLSIPPLGCIVAGGIRSFYIMTSAGAFQIRLGSVSGDNPVPKDSNKTMTCSYVISWTEATIT